MTSTSGSPGGFERSHPSEGMAALEKEQRLPLTGWQQEVDQAKRLGLEAAHSIVDRNISTFSRSSLSLASRFANFSISRILFASFASRYCISSNRCLYRPDHGKLICSKAI